MVVASLLPVTGAACRYDKIYCDSDSSCWTPEGNNRSASVPNNCKCCRGPPYFPGGECKR